MAIDAARIGQWSEYSAWLSQRVDATHLRCVMARRALDVRVTTSETEARLLMIEARR
jgi:hypothetical protein